MEKLLAIICCTMLVGSVQSQDFPAAAQKWHHQHHLMKSGIAKGKLTGSEAARLRKEYYQVRKEEHRMRISSRLANKAIDRSYGKHHPADKHLVRKERNIYLHNKDHTRPGKS